MKKNVRLLVNTTSNHARNVLLLVKTTTNHGRNVKLLVNTTANHAKMLDKWLKKQPITVMHARNF